MKKNGSEKRSAEQAIKDSIFFLLQSRHLDAITVKMICDTAGINRSSFYAHYDSIQALLDETAQEIHDICVSKIAIIEGIENKTVQVLITLSENRFFFAEYLNIFNNQTHYSPSPLVKRMNDFHNAVIRKYKITDMQFTFLKYGTIETVKKWLLSDCDKSAEDLAHDLMSMYRCILRENIEKYKKSGDGSGS